MIDESKLIVHKSNPLLDIKNDMSLYLQRMFNLYLAAINPLKRDTKHIRFPLYDFVRLLDITEVSPQKLHKLAQSAMKMCVDLYAIEDQDGRKKLTSRMDYVNVWHRFRVDRDDDGEWYVELEAHEDVLPYMFDLKDLGYVNFPVIYALRMRSNIAEKLYEQCARYKRLKKFSISPEELKKRLGVAGKASYKSYNKFKTGLLNRCIDEINEKTDLHVAIIEEERQHKRGAPVSRITFSIEQNPKEKSKKKKQDEEIEAMCEQSLPIDVAATEAELYEILKQKYGFPEKDAKVIVRDQKKYSLSDERVMEVIDYSLPRANAPEKAIGYIRTMLSMPDADLSEATKKPDGRGQAKKNPFNDFEHNEYDFDLLENELTAPADSPEPEPEKDLSELPPYYIVIGRPDVMDRLAAYKALGIPGDKIKILYEDDERLK